MRATLNIDPTSAVPIWRQVIGGMRRLVAAGALAPGEAIPSVRELARQLQVNPATVSKAYQRLVDKGVLVVRRGEGTYVAERDPETMASEREQLLGRAAAGYAAQARAIGASSAEAVTALETAWESAEDTSTGGAV